MRTHDERMPQSAKSPTPEPVYFVSDRPEAYEIWGEVSRDAAARFAEIIAERASKRFPNIRFQIDGRWHTHEHGMELISSYIESNWHRWVTKALGQSKAA